MLQVPVPPYFNNHYGNVRVEVIKLDTEIQTNAYIKKKTKEKNCLINLFAYQKLENLNSRFIKLRIQYPITIHVQPQSLTAGNC